MSERYKRLMQLREQQRELNAQIMRLEEDERDEIARPQLRSLIGHCFKYRNAYSHTEKWWMYAKIISFDESKMTFRTLKFQFTTDGKLQIEFQQEYNFSGKSRFSAEHGWTPISAREFKVRLREAQVFVAALQ